jgi:hypothetical protein
MSQRLTLNSNKGLQTPAEIASKKQKLQQNRDKIFKIETLQRKLNHVKQMIEQHTTRDPGFKNLFVK